MSTNRKWFWTGFCVASLVIVLAVLISGCATVSYKETLPARAINGLKRLDEIYRQDYCKNMQIVDFKEEIVGDFEPLVRSTYFLYDSVSREYYILVTYPGYLDGANYKQYRRRSYQETRALFDKE